MLVGATAGASPPGLTPPGGHSPTHHAVAPPPEVFPSSPMPTLPPPSRRAPGESAPGRRVQQGPGGYSIRAAGFTAYIADDGSIDFDPQRAGGPLTSPVYGLAMLLTFDVSDDLLRALRQDPYMAEKLRLADATRDERMTMRRRHDGVVMRRALDDLPSYLAAVWNQPDWSPALRRRILFALWDEAAEDGNAFLRAGGAEARRTIEGFIARELPPGSRHGYRAGELASLNRRRESRQRFAPYRSRPTGLARSAPDRPAPDAPVTLVAALRGL